MDLDLRPIPGGVRATTDRGNAGDSQPDPPAFRQAGHGRRPRHRRSPRRGRHARRRRAADRTPRPRSPRSSRPRPSRSTSDGRQIAHRIPRHRTAPARGGHAWRRPALDRVPPPRPRASRSTPPDLPSPPRLGRRTGERPACPVPAAGIRVHPGDRRSASGPDQAAVADASTGYDVRLNTAQLPAPPVEEHPNGGKNCPLTGGVTDIALPAEHV